MLDSAVEHYRRQQRITAAALVAIRRERGGPLAIARVITAFQILAARDASASVAQMVQEQGFDAPAVGSVEVTALAGVASDGRPLDTLMSLDQAANPTWLEMTSVSQIQDAARAAASLAIVSRPDISGWVRMMNPPSCSRCAVLAGKWFKWNQGFPRHPRCFPAGTVVSGPGADGATRRWYEGELVTVRTAGGKQFSTTGNHPVLTSEGWLPANLLREGGDVVGRASGDRSRALLVPDHDQMPARIEDLWASERMSPFGRVPVAAEDFHGDGVGSTHVDVVLADRLLGCGKEAAFLEQMREQALALGSVLPVALTDSGSRFEVSQTGLATTASVMRSLSLLTTLIGRQLARSEYAGFTRTADGNLSLDQAPTDQFARVPGARGDGVLALASQVGVDDGRAVHQQPLLARWDAPAVPLSLENRGAYAGPGLDLRDRLAGQVELDRVVEVTRIQWSGHVYNLTSAEGWYDANGIIVSNCDCRHIPAQEADYSDTRLSGDKWFHELSGPEQDRIFTKDGAQAVRDGADLNQVVNARRGMSTVQIGSRPAVVSTEGTTKRGIAFRGRTGRNMPQRVMPETIYLTALDREDAIRLLRLNGFVF